ncbi:NACHT domain-containing protein [Psychrobacter communis]|uniref:ATP-binding protein n=1 Tax=Psychrobacter communis TaxID=2762238 RepID=A0ABR8RHY6_9GAMM|nr:hypothetical protein [Psychrobacter communis]MBD7947411.1 hypothetical protein [Psychrobacter communis]
MLNYIEVDRQFSAVSKDKDDSQDIENYLKFNTGQSESWDLILSEYRCIVLAEAGAGKTIEFRERASLMKSKGGYAFFIRIEDIDRHFYESFEVGDEEAFDSWLDSDEEAWFFLDSVDEALLTSPRAFEKSIRCFAKAIKRGQLRAHIYISSRPYSWRVKTDQELMDEVLPLKGSDYQEGSNSNDEKSPSALKVYSLRPLDREKIAAYCQEKGVKDTDQLLDEVERIDLWSLAERPFDLDTIIDKWKDDKSLDGRLELIQHNIDLRLKESHSAGSRTALNTDLARSGAQRLAAAVVLTGNAEINVPDSERNKKGIDADTILYDWDKSDVKKLLESGLFNDILYGAVRFRHRDIRELLAAEFFSSLIKDNYNRLNIESYFFKDSLGESIVTPLLRPVLPWLILFDDNICAKTLNITPEVIIEGGDPSKLSVYTRQDAILKLIDNIDKDHYKAYTGSNIAIANLAQSDLESNVLELINNYKSNDNIILFLSRLVLQGGMAKCVDALIPIIIDNNKDKYTRTMSAKAVMSCGSREQKNAVWQGVNNSDKEIPRWLLSELVVDAEPNTATIDFIIDGIAKLAEPNDFMPTGLTRSMSRFIDHADGEVVYYLLNKFYHYLNVNDFFQKEECEVSKKDAWLMSVSLKCIERLVLTRNRCALSEVSFSMLIKAVLLEFHQGIYVDTCKNNLHSILPQWVEMNDALYWHSVEDARKKFGRDGKSFNHDLHLFYRQNYWRFETSDFSRVLAYVGSRPLNDKLVALSNAHRIYYQSDCPTDMLDDLRKAVSGSDVLQDKLERLLNPEISEKMKNYEEESKIRCEKARRRQDDLKNSKKDWIIHLCNNPSEVVTPSVGEGEITNNHVWLLDEIRKNSVDASCLYCTNWKSLIPEFGNEVALAYKDFCMNYWRCYKPRLKSEQDVDNSISNALLIALSGLEIESNEVSDFPNYLDTNDLNTALRYITWDIHGFPSWFERMHRAFPKATEDAMWKELVWELESSCSEGSLSHILQDLFHHAPWLHEFMAGRVLDYLMGRTSPLTIRKEYCVKILIKGSVESGKLATLADKYIALNADDCKEVAWWYALLVDSDADNGISKLENWLSGLNNTDAQQQAAAIFITGLLGGTYTQKTVYDAGKFKTAPHLKTLYMLMHKYIELSDDIQRAGKGVYSPTIRDDAQDARDRLLNYLVETPSKENYYALKQISKEHKDSLHKLLLQRRAYEMAERYGDIAPWSARQFKEFHKSKVLPPQTHRQLFELAVQQLKVLKDWVENGNDSPWLTWQKAAEENEVRTLIAGYLNQHKGGHYTIAEEPELANEQRMDIWLANPKIQSPVPIELKLLDKNWSGSKLCERLRNQLVGDYLREETAGCGVFLLVSLNQTKRWKIGDDIVSIDGLASALKRYWQTISDQYKGVEEIEVIVIDLKKRALVSNT